MDVLTRLSGEHETLLPLVVEMQAAAEAGDSEALAARIRGGRVELTSELDAHIALEEDDAFAAIENAIGEEFVAPFRAEHTEIRALRDEMLARVDTGNVPFNLCLQFCELIQAHMQREDAMLFPSARNALDAS